jgi:hypothetical protein
MTPSILYPPQVVSGDARRAALRAADWLSLAAAPTFAIMAALTGVLGGGPHEMLCSTASDASLVNGMVPMYLLMSAFHLAPWLKLISRLRRRAHQSMIPKSGYRFSEKIMLHEKS